MVRSRALSQGRRAQGRGAVVDQVLVCFVRDDEQVVLSGDSGQGPDLVVAVNLAGGVGRVAQDQGLGARGHGPLPFLRVKGPVLRAQGHEDRDPLGQPDLLQVGLVGGVWDQHLVAPLDHGQKGGQEPLHGPHGDPDLGGRIVDRAPLPGHEGRGLGPQLGHAGLEGVFPGPALPGQGRMHRLHDVGRGGEGGDALAQGDTPAHPGRDQGHLLDGRNLDPLDSPADFHENIPCHGTGPRDRVQGTGGIFIDHLSPQPSPLKGRGNYLADPARKGRGHCGRSSPRGERELWP